MQLLLDESVVLASRPILFIRVPTVIAAGKKPLFLTPMIIDIDGVNRSCMCADVLRAP